ncbi:MAG: hypothetical protein OEY50_06415, partial [Nitrospinota bacterium]|nr:hypothetical protein [Nitrospinota bacterium]
MDEKKDKNLKDLSQLIVAALTRDEAVMNALLDLKQRKVIEPSTLLGLALKINDLIELSNDKSPDQRIELIQERNDDAAVEAELDPVLKNPATPPTKPKAMIDGRQLTYDE